MAHFSALRLLSVNDDDRLRGFLALEVHAASNPRCST